MVLVPWIIVVFAVVLIAVLLATGRGKHAEESVPVVSRSSVSVESAGRGGARVTLPSVRPASPTRRKKQEKQTLRDRLVQAGLYRDNFVMVLNVLRFALLGPVCSGRLHAV